MEKVKLYGARINRRRMTRLKKDKRVVDLQMNHEYPTSETIKLIFTNYDELKETVDKIMKEGTRFEFKSSNYEEKEYYILLDWEDFLKLEDAIDLNLED